MKNKKKGERYLFPKNLIKTFVCLLLATCYLLPVFIAACGVDVRDTLGKIRRVQTISIVADPPEASPGSSVEIKATVVDPETWRQGSDQMVYYWVALYPDALTAINFNLNLSDFKLSDLLNLLAQCPQPQECGIFISQGNPCTITIPDHKIPEEESVPYSVFLLAADSAATLAAVIQGQDMTGKYDLAAKSVKVSEKTGVNHNPYIQEISAPPAIQDASMVNFHAGPGEKVTLTAKALDQDEGDTVAYRWWILKGRLEKDNLPEVEWTTPKEPGLYPVYLVARDEVGEKPKEEPKGGQAVVELTFEISEDMPGPP
ncbi:MAG: hypothetical protein PHE84_13410 [bacterium]|nr:hypothetical protein [bacterium]